MLLKNNLVCEYTANKLPITDTEGCQVRLEWERRTMTWN
uniref:Uncharacterized protein n=1 Tax=Anguilla anguilla TaxID=7936 RepID=A0A0E9RA38_ANGAN